MGVTHVIRGVDHLTNAARQTQIYEAMGWDVPVFAHVPLIHGPDGAKLSKRHGALGVEDYRDMGYLPEALRNYLVRLGWSHGDDEIISTEQMIEWFDLDDIGKSAARFDFAKLDDLNGHYIRATPERPRTCALAIRGDAAARIWPATARPDRGAARCRNDAAERWLAAAMPGLKERAKTLVELVEGAAYLVRRRGRWRSTTRRQKLLDAEARALLGGCCRGSRPPATGAPRRSKRGRAPYAESQAPSWAKSHSRCVRP